MATKQKGLGRGLEALLGGDSENDIIAAQQDRQGTLPVRVLQPGKYQPRTYMDPASLDELAESIKTQGLMQPILVRMVSAGKYEIIAGERRWRAAQKAGLAEVPVLIRDVPDETALAMSLIENIQRENLNPVEEAVGIKRLCDEFSLTHEVAAKAVGRSRVAVTNLLRLLNLAPAVQTMVRERKLDMGHARALLPLGSAAQILAANKVIAGTLSVRETERIVSAELSPVATKNRKNKVRPGTDRDLVRLQEELSDTLGARAEIKPGPKGSGKLVISYGSLDQLDGILARIAGGGTAQK